MRAPHVGVSCETERWDPLTADPADLAVDPLTVDLVNVNQVNADVMMTSAEPDPMLTSAGHVALSGAATCHAVCFSFTKILLLIPEIILSFIKS